MSPSNATGISSDPNATGIVSSPNVKGISSNPGAQGISSDPNATGTSSDPNAKGISSNPNATGIVSYPNAPRTIFHDVSGLLNEKIEWSDVPAEVQKTITENGGSGNIEEIKKKTEAVGGGLKSIYAAEVRKTDGSKIEIKVDEDGNLIESDRD